MKSTAIANVNGPIRISCVGFFENDAEAAGGALHIYNGGPCRDYSEDVIGDSAVGFADLLEVLSGVGACPWRLP